MPIKPYLHLHALISRSPPCPPQLPAHTAAAALMALASSTASTKSTVRVSLEGQEGSLFRGALSDELSGVNRLDGTSYSQ
jgi:hypothetical protein